MNLKELMSMIRNRLGREDIYSRAEYWDGKASSFSGDAVSMWPNNELNALYHREQLELFDRYLPPLEGKRVLDIGCGTGRLSRFLASRGAIVDGFDFSAKSIDIATRLSNGTDNPTYRVLSVFDLEVEEPYDVLISWGSITVACKDTAELLRVLDRLYRALKPGGEILLLEPIHRGFLHRVLDMSVDNFVELMERAGFVIEAKDELHFWPARLALAYVPLPVAPTRLGYHLGQRLMDRLGRGGDYKAIKGLRP